MVMVAGEEKVAETADMEKVREIAEQCIKDNRLIFKALSKI